MYKTLAYVAGPYRDKTEWGIETNIRNAERVALDLWQEGIPAICPHKNTSRWGGAASDECWLEGDIIMMLRCDLVVVCPGWEHSEGTMAEIAAAKNAGIPVFFVGGEQPYKTWDDALTFARTGKFII